MGGGIVGPRRCSGERRTKYFLIGAEVVANFLQLFGEIRRKPVNLGYGHQCPAERAEGGFHCHQAGALIGAPRFEGRHQDARAMLKLEVGDILPLHLRKNEFRKRVSMSRHGYSRGKSSVLPVQAIPRGRNIHAPVSAE